jgi:hypothetical protein
MKRYEPADALDGDTLVHRLYVHWDRVAKTRAKDGIEELMHAQAEQLGRRPTGPVEWAPPVDAEHFVHPVAVLVARLPTEVTR